MQITTINGQPTLLIDRPSPLPTPSRRPQSPTE